jgi:hypothetical protein
MVEQVNSELEQMSSVGTHHELIATPAQAPVQTGAQANIPQQANTPQHVIPPHIDPGNQSPFNFKKLL